MPRGWISPRPAPCAISRVYDYLLGGKHHYAVDRDASHAMIEAVPETPLLAKANRSFVRRAVQYLVGEAGIKQIIDIGSGLPTAGNVHEIAQEIDLTVRVVYVDKDPIVLAYGRALLSSNDNTTVITADLRCSDPGDPRARELNRIFAKTGMGSRCFRPFDEQLPYFDGLDLVEPGLVACNAWRPSPDFPDPHNPAHPMVIGGVGRKP